MVWPKQSECNAFYGNPSGRNGREDTTWKRNNIVSVPLPWRAVAAWDTSSRVKSLGVHRLVSGSLAGVLDTIWTQAGKRQTEIERMRMHLIGGGYSFRTMRHSAHLSMHAYGAAVDFDPERNGLGDTTPAMAPAVVQAFESAGWVWGGRWSGSRIDGMHFQAARLG